MNGRTTGLDFIRYIVPAHSGYKFTYRGIPGKVISRQFMFDPFMPGVLILREEVATFLKSTSIFLYVMGTANLDLMVTSCTERINGKTVLSLKADYPYIRLPESFDAASTWT